MTEEIKCNSYYTTEGLKFCMSSVCEKKDCIYHLMNDLYQKNDRLKQENEALNKKYTEVLTLAKQNADANEFVIQDLEKENEKLKCLLVDISDMATVNAITTCWTVMDNCDKCSDVKECGTQSPLMKLQIIRNKINECIGG